MTCEDAGGVDKQLLKLDPDLEALVIDAVNISTDITTGTKIATGATQKLGFFGATPIVQLAKADYNNWAAFTDIVDALVAIGLFDAA